MRAKVFFDTNILIYSVTESDRTGRADELLKSGGMVSVQVLNEFTSVVRRKMKMTWAQVDESLDAIRILCPDPVSLTVRTHTAALQIARRYRCEIYDALILASALQANCEVLYSEDLQPGQIIEGRLRVQNPFR